MADEIKTIISTLIQSGLASSEGEAKRMAESMMTTTSKVSQQFADRKDNNHMFADKVKAKQKAREEAIPKPEVTQSIASQNAVRSDAMQSKIDELRLAALNPEPVNVQVNFQTPRRDNKPIQTETIAPEPQIAPVIKPEVKGFNQMANGEVPIPTPQANDIPINIPGIDNNLTINELASNNTNEAPKENFFAQNKQTTIISKLESEPELKVEEKPVQEGFPAMDSGFSYDEHSGFGQKTQKIPQEPIQQSPSSDFLQVKKDPKPVENNSFQNNNRLNTGFPQNNVQEPIQQQAPTQEPQFQSQSAPKPIFQSSKPVSENIPKTNTPQRNATWTEEEKKLKEDVDLSKVFNFNK